jgi:hypothetical protein
MEEELDNAETGTLNESSILQRHLVEMVVYKIGSMAVKSQADIDNLTPDQRRILGTALNALGGKEAVIYGRVVELIKEGIERIQENEIEENPFEEREGPFDTSNN